MIQSALPTTTSFLKASRFSPRRFICLKTAPAAAQSHSKQDTTGRMNGIFHRSQIRPGDCTLYSSPGAFTYNSRLPLTHSAVPPPLPADKVRLHESLHLLTGMNLKPLLSDFLCLCPSFVYLCVCVCVLHASVPPDYNAGWLRGRENTVTASFPKLSSHKWGIKAGKQGG